MRFLAPSDKRWFWFVAAAWAMVFSVATWSKLTPASHWFEVGTVQVMDAEAGAQPLMAVVRKIKRPFRGEWITTVLKEDSGAYSVFCSAHGVNDYRPENSLPPAMDLAWWTYPTRCALKPGRYKITTLWTIHAPGYPPKEVRAVSNVFHVEPTPPRQF